MTCPCGNIAGPTGLCGDCFLNHNASMLTPTQSPDEHVEQLVREWETRIRMSNRGVSFPLETDLQYVARLHLAAVAKLEAEYKVRLTERSNQITTLEQENRRLVEEVEKEKWTADARVQAVSGERQVLQIELSTLRTALRAVCEAAESASVALDNSGNSLAATNLLKFVTAAALLLAEQPVEKGGAGRWYCKSCETAVEPDMVTNSEHHDSRAGGCGNPVDWIEPFTEPKPR